MQVVIVGGGIGGLTLGLALAQRNIPFQIYEKAAGLSEVGAGITLWSNAITVLRHLGIEGVVEAVSEPAAGARIGLADGSTLVDAKPEALALNGKQLEMWAAHRVKLQQALYEALPEGSVHFNARLASFSQSEGGIKAEFEGHEPVTGSLLVGADGIHSAVRAQMRGANGLRYAGYVAWRGVCSAPPGWAGDTGEFWGRGDRFGLVKIAEDEIYWFAVVSAAADSAMRRGEVSGGADGAKEYLLSRFGDYQLQVPKVLENTSPEAIIFREIADRVPQSGWSEGRATLLGDAAHPTTPNMGQGAAMAMESALVLARCLDEIDDQSLALKTYEHLRFKRAAHVTNTSWTVGKMAHWENALARGFRNVMFKSMPASSRVKQLHAIGGYDAGQVPLSS